MAIGLFLLRLVVGAIFTGHGRYRRDELDEIRPLRPAV
jgi:hypothetical protein